MQKKLKEFEKAGFTVQEEEKLIHSAESIRFMQDVIKAGKWQMDVLKNELEYLLIIIVFVQGGSPTPHPFSSRPHFVCKFSRQRSTEVF